MNPQDFITQMEAMRSHYKSVDRHMSYTVVSAMLSQAASKGLTREQLRKARPPVDPCADHVQNGRYNPAYEDVKQIVETIRKKREIRNMANQQIDELFDKMIGQGKYHPLQQDQMVQLSDLMAKFLMDFCLKLEGAL
ncbi:MAG: hypothetical protein AAF614_39155 [Chloroflexota bacterium]